MNNIQFSICVQMEILLRRMNFYGTVCKKNSPLSHPKRCSKTLVSPNIIFADRQSDNIIIYSQLSSSV